jgi:hypothetical protein
MGRPREEMGATQDDDDDIPIARQFSVCRAKNLLIWLVFLEP